MFLLQLRGNKHQQSILEIFAFIIAIKIRHGSLCHFA